MNGRHGLFIQNLAEHAANRDPDYFGRRFVVGPVTLVHGFDGPLDNAQPIFHTFFRLQQTRRGEPRFVMERATWASRTTVTTNIPLYMAR